MHREWCPPPDTDIDKLRHDEIQWEALQLLHTSGYFHERRYWSKRRARPLPITRADGALTGSELDFLMSVRKDLFRQINDEVSKALGMV